MILVRLSFPERDPMDRNPFTCDTKYPIWELQLSFNRNNKDGANIAS